jgi:dTDP-4-amino-4,6-dideoxygalactose transaminase
MRQIPFHRPSIGPAEEREVLDSLRSGWITTGPKAKRFEKEFAAYVGARHAVAVAHCTGALHLALFALGIGPGDEIITTPFTFTATAEVMGYLGARPLFVDIEPETLNIDPARIEEALASGQHRQVRALLPVHFAGLACDMDRLLAIARRYSLKIVEDAAHAVGSARHLEGRGMVRVGTIGDLTCFSFYATKNITSAEGGMITTEDDALAERISIASLHGMNRDAWKRYDRSGSWFYEIHDTGFKYNLSDVHAAIGLAQLARADELTARRGAIAHAYSEAFHI